MASFEHADIFFFKQWMNVWYSLRQAFSLDHRTYVVLVVLRAITCSYKAIFLSVCEGRMLIVSYDA